MKQRDKDPIINSIDYGEQDVIKVYIKYIYCIAISIRYNSFPCGFSRVYDQNVKSLISPKHKHNKT